MSLLNDILRELHNSIKKLGIGLGFGSRNPNPNPPPPPPNPNPTKIWLGHVLAQIQKSFAQVGAGITAAISKARTPTTFNPNLSIPTLTGVLQSLQRKLSGGTANYLTGQAPSPLNQQFLGLLNQIQQKLGGAQYHGGQAGKGSLAELLGLSNDPNATKADKLSMLSGTLQTLGFANLGKGVGYKSLAESAKGGNSEAMLAVVKESLDAIRYGASGLGQAGSRALHSQTQTDFVGAAASGVTAMGSTATMLGAPQLGLPIAALGKLAEVTFGAVGKIRQFSEELYNTNIRFGEFSAAMAGVQARKEIRDIQYGIKQGNRLAPSTERLAEATAEYNRITSAGDARLGELKNDAAAWWEDLKSKAFLGARYALTGQTDIMPSKRLLGLKDTVPEADYSDLLTASDKKQWYEKWGRPPRFGGMDIE